MRSSLPIPALAFLALALAGCEVQPVVSNIAPAPAVEAETHAAETTLADTSSEAGDVAGIPEIVSEAEPETAIEQTDTVADTAAEQDDPAAETAEAGQPDSAEPVTAPATPAAIAEVTGEVADVALTGASEQDDPAAETAETNQPDSAEPVTPPATPAAIAEVTGEVADVALTGASEQAEQELPQTGDLAMAAPPAPPPPPPPPPELEPSLLIGISIPMLQSRLGEADFTRTEGEVETWQYRFEPCVVDYFLVVNSHATRVVSWAWRAPVIGAQIDETACRRALAGRDAAS